MNRIYSASSDRSPEQSAPLATDDDPTPAPFPTDALPDAARNMVNAIADCRRVPHSLAGCCVLGIISASIGKGLKVQSGPDRTTPGNLFIVPAAESGTGKSEANRDAATPLADYEQHLADTWRNNQLPGLLAERDILEAEITKLTKSASRAKDSTERDKLRIIVTDKKTKLQELDAKLVQPQFVTEDVTSERLAVLLSKHGECMSSLSPDAGAVVNILLGRYAGNIKRTDETLYLKAFSWDSCRIDRQCRETITLREPCLSALWLVQPDKLDALLAERSLTEGGLIPRLLTCHTNCQPQEITNDQRGIPPDVAETYRRLIHDLLTAYRLNTETRIIPCSADAMKFLNDHHNIIVRERRAGLRDVTSYAARWNEQAWRIAVALHAMQHGNSAHDHALSAATALQAITIAKWFADQQLDILAGGRDLARREKRNEVLELLAEKPAGITARDVQRARIARDADEAKQLLASLDGTTGPLEGRDVTPPHGGKTARVYTRKRSC